MEAGIKYNCLWQESGPEDETILAPLKKWRERMYTLGWVGAYPNGIGYGNLSIRVQGDPLEFVITGTETGKIKELDSSHYTRVIAFDIDRNELTCRGPVRASAESLTHAAVYLSHPSVKAVIHIHNLELWEKYLNKLPTTAPEAEYGTPEMAHELTRLCVKPKVKTRPVVVMSGHREGLIAFGSDLDEVGRILMQLV